MIRVLQVVPDMRSGGLETLIMNWYRNIDRSKVQFDFLVHYTHKAFYDDEITEMGGKIYRLSFREDKNLLKYCWDLNSFFSKYHNEYHVVHGHMASLAFFYLHYAKKYSCQMRIVHSHNAATEKSIKGFVKHMLIKLSVWPANYYFACGKEAGKFLFGKRKYTVINNGIELEKFQYNEDIRSKYRYDLNLKGKFVIGHVGRFNIQKNHDFLIRIFKEIHSINKNTVLVLVGNGERMSEIIKKVSEMGLENSVLFLGARHDVSSLYQAMDVFLLPSYFEGFPVVSIECQAAGLPMIISDLITKEVAITSIVSYMGLDEQPVKWAHKALEFQNFQREGYGKLLRERGYDTKNETERLVDFYKKAY